MSETIEGTALVVRESSAPAPVEVWVPRLAFTVDDAVRHSEEMREFQRRVMVKDVHYGVIPGTPKPTLYKPGAELLLSRMGLHPDCIDVGEQILDFGGKMFGEPFIYHRRKCLIYRQTGPTVNDRVIIAALEGSCSNWEEKYRYRNDSVKCPKCGKAAVIKGLEKYGGGWICFKKKDGCGAKFGEKDPAIVSQPVGKILNPNFADIANTILKMADKRALIASTLVATGCSDFFTQDVEDFAGSSDTAAAAAAVEDSVDPEPPERAPLAVSALKELYAEKKMPLAFSAWLVEAGIIPAGKGSLSADEKLAAEDAIAKLPVYGASDASFVPADPKEGAAQTTLPQGKDAPKAGTATPQQQNDIRKLAADLGWDAVQLAAQIEDVAKGKRTVYELSATQAVAVLAEMDAELYAREVAAASTVSA